MTDDIVALLSALKHAITPGKGRQTVLLIHDICQRHGLDEDEFLPTYVVRMKRAGRPVHGVHLSGE